MLHALDNIKTKELMMWKEIIEKKRWIIMVPIVMVILLLISLEVYVDIKSQKIDEEYGVH